jgi:tetratricopeptide (TPR) repeat protein
MGTEARLCLNMIVRSEVAILQRCLRSVADHIACWVIVDTGSNDGTQSVIEEFFAARGIPGTLRDVSWENFSQARNQALGQARASTLEYDYLLLSDADMELVVEDPAFRDDLDAAAYDVQQRSTVHYWNPRLLRRDSAARYVGATHEYLDVAEHKERLSGVWFRDHADGSNRPGKYQRDVALLQGELARDPDNARTQFYLAQTYRDMGRTADAEAAYARRAAMGGWDEEAWYARWQQARMLLALDNDSGFSAHALAAYNLRPHRAEPLYDLGRFHRMRNQHDAALLYADAGLGLPYPQRDALFVDDFIYRCGLKEELSISGFYSKSEKIGSAVGRSVIS